MAVSVAGSETVPLYGKSGKKEHDITFRAPFTRLSLVSTLEAATGTAFPVLEETGQDIAIDYVGYDRLP